MKLCASLIVRNELGRYLEQCIGHLLEFCDEIRILDDGSDDGSYEWFRDLTPRANINVLLNGTPEFFEHEGRTRNELLEWTLAAEPSHVIAIDADELVTDGALVRAACERSDAQAFSLVMQEVWEADDDGLCIRHDGGWAPHPVPVLWRVPERMDASWRIADRALACGRVPVAIDRIAGHAETIGELFHFGWTNEAERQARYDRYAVADGGRFHASAHLESIMWPCERVRLQPAAWPVGLESRKAALLGRANGVAA